MMFTFKSITFDYWQLIWTQFKTRLRSLRTPDGDARLLSSVSGEKNRASRRLKQNVSTSLLLSWSSINNISFVIILYFEIRVLSSVIESHGHRSLKSSVECLFVFVFFSFTWSKGDAEDNKRCWVQNRGQRWQDC